MIAILFVIILFGVYYITFHNAPVGYEDRDGFHYGEPKQ